MSLADAIRIKNLEAEFATLTRRLDALDRRLAAYEVYIEEVDSRLLNDPIPDELPPEPKRGPGRPKKN